MLASSDKGFVVLISPGGLVVPGSVSSIMTNTSAARIAAFLGLLAVVLGACGAHGPVHEVLVTNQKTDIWERAVFYHFVHTVMIFILASRSPVATGPSLAFLTGIVLFSGSLYVLALTNVRILGAVTPFGGMSFIVGWAWLFIRPNHNHR
jgi:uncharacterized membrane protein YgdD (TMEM256/DUF423 family)